MKYIIKAVLVMVAFAGLTLSGCNEDYDPIGNNKPATKLKMTPRYVAFDGKGGTQETSINTNAPDVAIGTLPEWVQSATLNSEKTALSVVVKENTTNDIRTGVIALTTVTGETESSLTLNLAQAGKSARICFDSFTGDALDDGWKYTNRSAATIGSGNLVLQGVANGIGNSMYYQAQSGLVAQSNGGVGNVVTAYVDMKTDPNNEGGLKVYYNPLTGEEFRFFFTMNSATNGSFYAFRFKNNNQEAMALGDAIPGTGMPAVPGTGERDEYMRIEFTNVARLPNWWQSEINIYSLQTRNGETKVLQKHFSRKFEIDGPKPIPGYFGLWGRFGNVAFKNFTLSAQEN